MNRAGLTAGKTPNGAKQMKPSDVILQLLESRNNLAQVSASDYAHADLIAARNRCRAARQAVDDLFALPPEDAPAPDNNAADSQYLTGTGCPPSDDGYRVTLAEAEHELKNTSYTVAQSNGVVRLVIVGTSLDISTRGRLRDAMKVLGVKGNPEKRDGYLDFKFCNGDVEVRQGGRAIELRTGDSVSTMTPLYARELGNKFIAIADAIEAGR